MTEKYNVLEAITLAGLLHDIGKFAQRASESLNDLPEQIRSQKEMICPFWQGSYYSHLHVLWTLAFFEQNAEHFPLPVKSYSFSPEQTDTIANMAAFHHISNLTPFQEIIKQADWLSAGMDRVKHFDEEDIQDKKARFRIQRLQSPFALIELTDRPKEKNYFYPLLPFAVDDRSFPEKGPFDVDLTPEYHDLWNRFLRDFRSLPQDHFIDRVMALLEMYTCTIPSSTIDLPDISLFDHCKTSAAFAQALYLYHSALDTLTVQRLQDWEEKKFILLSGDLSGIQNYIFKLNLSNVRGVNKILRARSFYLQMMTRVVIHYLLQSLGMLDVAVIMDAGGRFLLLLPNLGRVTDTLQQIRKELDTWFLTRFAGELALNLNWDVVLSGNDFRQENFRQVLYNLVQKTDRQKKRKFFSFFAPGGWESSRFIISKPFEGFKDHDRCESCGIYPGTEIVREFATERNVCPHCKNDQTIGKWLLETNGIAISPKDDLPGKKISFLHGKFSVYLLQNVEKMDLRLYDRVFVTSPYFENPSLPRHLIASHVPCFKPGDELLFKALREEDEDPDLDLNREPRKTFHHLAKKGTVDPETLEEIGGQAMLGVLKADVDSLGQIFSDGFGEKVSISRFTTLSRLLNHFFVGYLMNVLETEANGSIGFSDIYTVYSGGDDLLFIGEWKDIIAFARLLQEKFQEYTCKNPDVHLSAGIAMIPARFPVNKGIDQAEKLLHQAKEKGKDRIALFDTVVLWNEFPRLMEYAHFFDESIQNNDSKINNAFMYRLLQYHRMFLNFHENNDVDQLIYLSHMLYDVGRNIVEFDRRTKEVVEKDRRTYEKLLPLLSSKPEDFWLMKNLKIPVFYAMYKNRRRKKQKGGENS